MIYPKNSSIPFLCISILFWLFSINSARGQAMPLPEQDCIGAIPICDLVISQPNSYTGEGAMPNEIDRDISCLGSGEENNVWYQLTVSQAGFLSFIITPFNSFDDYDFAVYNLSNASCSDIATDPSLEISCNYSATSGATGANLPGGASSNSAGGPNRNGLIPVLAGETYVIFVSNFSSTAGGFTLDLSASSAVFSNDTSTLISLDSLYQNGNSDSLVIAFSEPIFCSDIQSQSLEVFLDANLIQIDSIWGTACEAGNPLSSTFNILLDTPLPPFAQLSVNLVDTVSGFCGKIGFEGNLSLVLGFEVQASREQICSGDSILLWTNLRDSSFSVFWPNEGISTDSIWLRPDSSQWYIAQINDSAQNLLGADSIFIVVNPNPIIDLGVDTSFCSDGLRLTLPAGVWESFIWENGSRDSSRLILTNGSYSLTVRDSNNCVGQDSITATGIFAVISNFIWSDDSVEVTFTNRSANFDSLFWDFGDGNFSTDLNPVHQYDSAGVYSVSLISANACGRDTVIETITINAWPTNIVSEFISKYLNIQPNPALDQIELHFSHEGFWGKDIGLYSLQGKLLRDLGKVRSDKLLLERGQLASGIYLLRIGNMATKLWFE